MTQPPESPSPTLAPPRVVAHFRGEEPGPTLITVGAIHGNETAGVQAMERVKRWLQKNDVRIRGEWLGLCGNRRAIAEGRRFIAQDLNRCWSHHDLVALANGEDLTPESQEQTELHQEISGAVGRARGPLHLVDLHTSSSSGPPFVCTGDTLRNRNFALKLSIPLVLGLEECIEGALVDHITTQGHVAIAVEGGLHGEPESIDNHEAAINIALVAAGLVKPMADYGRYRNTLRLAASGLAPVYEIRYRHAIGDGFRMRPGHRSFRPIEAGAILADDDQGTVAAPEKGCILLPLYQGQGEDGFFIIRRVRMMWLWISSLLRRLGAHRFAFIMPGVQRHPHIPGALLVDPKIARWFTVEVFHLLGYRRERNEGPMKVLSRRPFDDP